MSNLTVFQFEQNEVRFVGTADDPWWVAADVCAVLGIKNIGDALSRLDDDEKKDDIVITDAIGRSQAVWCINESGLYSLVLTSRKPQAKRFRKWVTSIVLPSIRSSGSYALAQEPKEPQNALTPEKPSLQELSDFYELTLAKAGIDQRIVASVKINGMTRYYPALTEAGEIGKSALSIPIEAELVRPTVLGEKLSEITGENWTAIRVNKLLLDQGFQIKNPDGKNPAYLPTEKGDVYSQLVLDTARGRDKTIQSLQWHLSVLEALEMNDH